MLGRLIQTDLEEMIQQKNWRELRESVAGLTDQDVAEIMIDLPVEDEGIIFRLLPRQRAGSIFAYLPLEHQEELIRSLSSDQTRDLLNSLTPDDRVRLLDELPATITRRVLDGLRPEEREKTRQLLGYPPNTAGHFMTPNYIALTPTMTAGEALDHIRHSPRSTETLYIVYVLDDAGALVNELRLPTLVRAEPESIVGELHDRPLVSIPAHADREEVVHAFDKYDRVALPVVDDNGQMLGIITVDDVIDVARMETTEDMQKMGGLEAIDTPYATTPFLTLLKKRAGWLSILFVGEMLTATAMGYFEDEIAKAVVLALFVPLIISSGGNSGSQTATLIIRSLALSELRLGDWWKVVRKELASGLALGTWLGLIGFVRIVLWQRMGWVDYGGHTTRLALTIWISLVGVVCFGTIAGSMLPFVLRACRLDPATCSAPFVATLVDVTGLAIYFGVAALILRGTLL